MNSSDSYKPKSTGQCIDRRNFLWRSGGGLGGIALSEMLGRDGVLANTKETLHPVGLHHAPKAKRVIQLFMGGAASHVDLFDFKPELIKRHGEKWDPGETIELFQSSPGNTYKSPWDWSNYGQCGKPLTSIVSELSECVDDMAFVHNVVGKTGVHSQATYLQATGFQRPGFPGMGAWVSYGLGSLNDNLPTFIVLPDHRGYASNGPKNWSSAFLPASHQGTTLFPGRTNPIADLYPPKESFINNKSEIATQELLSKFNRKHAAIRETDSRLDARIKSYELAARMQLSAPEALDISKEPSHVKSLYGLDHNVQNWPKEINEIEEIDYFSRKCLVARRLLERGVRFIQIWSGNDNGFPRRNWDSHEDIKRDHGPLARGMARGTAALILDLKQRGMLEDTLILWTTEFGRMPCAQGSKGRDHNPFVFTNWMAGGGIRGGTTYGESDEWGFRPADRNNPTTCHDIHATIMHQLGINHEQLTVRHDGIDRRLTDVHGSVIQPILA